jgi:hypothetical protein
VLLVFPPPKLVLNLCGMPHFSPYSFAITLC